MALRFSSAALRAALVAMAVPVPAYAQSNEATGAFALAGGSARSAVLGEAYGALGGDVDALHWNPAALETITSTHVQASHHDVFGLGLARHTSLGFATRPLVDDLVMDGDTLRVVTRSAVGPVYAVAISALVVELGEEESYWEFAPVVALAHRAPSATAFGVAARYLRASSTLTGVSATGYALDVGVSQEIGRGACVAISFRNLLGHVKWKEGREEARPREVVLSTAIPIIARVDLAGGAATDLDSDLTDRWNVAASVRAWPEKLTFLAGVESRRDGEDMRARLLAGASVGVAGLRLDYAFVPGAYTPGETHHVTLRLEL